MSGIHLFTYTTLLLGVQWIVHPVLNEVSNFELTKEFARTATKSCPTRLSEHIGACITTMILNGGIEMVSRVKI